MVNQPPPDDPGPSYPGPGYPDYGPPYGHAQPGYPPSTGYGIPGYYPPPTGYGTPGYPPTGHGTPGYPPPVMSPGVIPLRPLSLSDIYNGAVGYIRANPKATLGLTALVVVITRIVTLVTQVGPLAFINHLAAGSPSYQLSGRDVVAWGSAILTGAIVTSLCTTVLVGMLTVVVGRAVFGASITIGEAWAMVRDRFLALIGFAVLLSLASAVLIGLVLFLIIAAIAVAHAAGAVLSGIPLILALVAALTYLYVMVSFAATAIVLERLGVFAAIGRSFALVRNNFWRVLGILVLTALVAYLVIGAVAMPFNLAGIALGGTGSLTQISLGSLGTTIGQIIVLPFTAGVVVLLYTDRRIRAEAFDLVLRTGAAQGPQATGSTDSLWLTRPPV